MSRSTVGTNDQGGAPGLAARRQEHFFFSGMAVLLFVTVFVGFAPTYYLAGIIPAPEPGRVHLPSTIVRVHAVVSTIWMLLFAAQVGLVTAQRVQFHRRLGLVGVVAVCAMFVTGLMAGTDTLIRNVPPGLAELLYLVNVSMASVFTVLMAFAFWWRNSPPAHKRLVLIANIALLFAPLIRIPVASLYLNMSGATRACYWFLLPLIVYDLWSSRRIHPATLWASAFLVLVYEVRFVVADTAPWLAFSAWMRAMAS